MEKEKSKTVSGKLKKSVLTLFILLFPVLLLALVDSPTEKILVFIYTAIVLKNFVDDHYAGK